MSGHEFFALLPQLTVVDNQLRYAAETRYAALLRDQADYAVFGLLQVLAASHVEAHIRQLSAVLLRRTLVDEEESVYFRLSPQGKQEILKELLRLLREESNTTIRLRVCDIAGELGGTILEPKDWPDLATTTFNLCKSTTSSADREVGLSLLGLLADSQVAQNEAVLQPIFELLQLNFHQYGNGSLQDNGKGLMLTLKALNYTIQSLRMPSQLDVLKPLVPTIFQTFGNMIQQCITLTANNTAPSSSSQEHIQHNNPTAVDRPLCQFAEHLVDIADHSSHFFVDHLEHFLAPVLNCIEVTSTLSNHLKFLLIEFLVALCNGVTKRMRKCKGPQGEKDYFASRFFPICLQMMAMVHHEGQWEVADSVEEGHYDSSSCDVGEAALRRASASLGVRTTYSIISTLLGRYLLDADHWESQYAGLQCVACYVEVSTNLSNADQLELHRKEVLGTLLHFLTHNHPRIRYGSLFALSQFLLFHGSGLDTDQMLSIMQAITQSLPMQVNPSPRVRRNAMIALIQWIDVIPTSFLLDEQTQYSTQLLAMICQALREGPTIVQESCVSAIISIAESTRSMSDTWLHHYPSIMPILKELLTYSYRKGFESLWSQALECITIVGETAGKFLFYQDAMEMMDLLTRVQNQLEPHSELETVLIKAWVRIARCLGSEFLPYLQVTVDKLFLAMSQDVTVPTNANQEGRNDDDDDDIDAFDEDEEEDDDVEMIETGDGWVTVRTSLVEEQASAVQMVLLLAEKLQEHYYPYVEQTVRLLTNLVSSPHEDIRSFAIAALPELVRSTGKAQPANRAPLVELSGYCLGLLVKCLGVESALDLIMTTLQSIRQILLFSCADWGKLMHQRTAAGGNSGNSSNAGNGGASSTVAESPGVNDLGAAAGFLKTLDDSQMLILTQAIKQVLRDSLQRRAVLKAEAQTQQREDPFDEDDLDEEQQFFQESLELHFNISEVLNALFQTHTTSFYPIFYTEWNELITTLSHPFCLPEDRRFSFLVISDVIQFGVSAHTALEINNNSNNTATTAADGSSVQSTAQEYLSQVMPMLIETCSASTDFELKRTACYAIGIAYELHASVLQAFLGDALQALRNVTTAPLDDPEDVDEYGLCVDNAVSSVGIITEQTLILNIQFHQEFLLAQWLQMLPLKNDLEEGEKVLKQLLRMLAERRAIFNNNVGLLASTVIVLSQALEQKGLPKPLLRECAKVLYALFMNDDLSIPIKSYLTSEQQNRIHLILGQAQESGLLYTGPNIASSPLDTAPIYDVLMQRQFK